MLLPGFLPSLSMRRFCALRAARIARLLILRCSFWKASIEFSDAVSMAWRAGRAGDLVELSPCAMACTSTTEMRLNPTGRGVCDGGQLCFGEVSLRLLEILWGRFARFSLMREGTRGNLLPWMNSSSMSKLTKVGGYSPSVAENLFLPMAPTGMT